MQLTRRELVVSEAGLVGVVRARVHERRPRDHWNLSRFALGENATERTRAGWCRQADLGPRHVSVEAMLRVNRREQPAAFLDGLGRAEQQRCRRPKREMKDLQCPALGI